MNIRRFPFSLAIIFLLFLSACYRPGPKDSMIDLQALAGTWSSQKLQFFETWEIKSDTLMEGLGYSMLGTDTVFKKKLKFFCKEECVFLAVRQSDEHDYTLFKLVTAKKFRWVFENEKHKYPNIITYDLSGNELVATLMNDKSHKKIEFNMIRL